MMTTSYCLITSVLLLLTSLCYNVAARPITVVNSIGYADDAITGTIDIISLAAVKSGGGPSPGGKGHEFPTAKSFGNDKNSGPSPGGKGHDFTNDKILGYMKNSGPSPGGKGHGFHNAETFGNIKNSGPSYRPFFGCKGDMVPISEDLWNLKNSGPSFGGTGH